MKTLSPLNTTTFYCGGCGISPAPLPGELCKTCVRQTQIEEMNSDGIEAGPLFIALVVTAMILGVILLVGWLLK